jgi:hypothetical protein
MCVGVCEGALLMLALDGDESSMNAAKAGYSFPASYVVQ